MRLHPRYYIVKAFELDLREAIGPVIEKHKELTTLEVARALHAVLSGEVGGWLNYAMREERHPGDPDKRADEE